MARGPNRDGFTGSRDALVEEALKSARRTGSGWWTMNCPFCIDRVGKVDRARKLGVHEDSRIWHCFRCGAKGMLSDGDHRALRSMVVEVVPQESGENPHRPPEGFWSLSDEEARSSYALAPALEYLARRGVSPAVVAAAQVGACVAGKYADRVVVPVLPAPGAQPPPRGPWHGFIARSWHPKGSVSATYLYPSGMPKGRFLYNEEALDVETEVPVLVVEGAFDTFPFWPDAVALLGDASELQVRKLARAKRPVAVALDGDAWRKGIALAQRLRMDGQRAGAIVLPPCMDPDQLRAMLVREAAWDCIGGVVNLAA